MATEIVDKLGLEKLKEYGYLSEDLSANESFWNDADLPEGDAATIVDVILGCVDYRDWVADFVDPGAPDSDPHVRKCTAAVTEDDLRTSLVAGLSGGDAGGVFQKLARAGCFPEFE